jgi:hypothetical protein
MGAPGKLANFGIVIGMIFALAVVPTIIHFRWAIVFGSFGLFLLVGN